MTKRMIAVVAGTLLTAGVIGAVAATGPDGGDGPGMGPGGMMGRMMGGQRGGPHRMGGQIGGMMRGWFGPRSITADEYDTRTRERFARLDKNSDGVLDATEIEAAVSQRQQPRGGMMGRMMGGPRGQAGPQAGPGGQFLRQFGDKDGKVTKDAYLAEMKRRFAVMDLNNDGKITDDDLPPMMRGKNMLKADGPAVPGPMARMLGGLRAADVKQDGVITQEAFLAAATKRFDDLDRNKDGVVNQADFDAMRKEMVDYRVKRFLHRYGADKDGKVTREQFFKVAKDRFARLDPKGEGKITLGGGGMGGHRGGQDGQPGGPGGMPMPPKN